MDVEFECGDWRGVSLLDFFLCLTPGLFSSNTFLACKTVLYQTHLTVSIEHKVYSSFIAPINPK